MRVDWSAEIPGNRIELERRDSHLYFEAGRPDWPGRGHEGIGGTFTVEALRRDPARFLGEFPGLYGRVIETYTERNRIVDTPVAALTIGDTDSTLPTVHVPFAIDGDRLYVPLDAADVAPHVWRSLLAELEAAPEPPTVDVDIHGADGGHEWHAQLLGTATLIPNKPTWLSDIAEVIVWKYPAMRDITHVTILCVDIILWDARTT